MEEVIVDVVHHVCTAACDHGSTNVFLSFIESFFHSLICSDHSHSHSISRGLTGIVWSVVDYAIHILSCVIFCEIIHNRLHKHSGHCNKHD